MLTAMTLVTLAAGLGLYIQMGWTLWGAATAALSLYLVLATAHALVRRFERLRELSEEVERLEGEMSRFTRGAAVPHPARAPGGPRAPLFAAPQPPHDGAFAPDMPSMAAAPTASRFAGAGSPPSGGGHVPDPAADGSASARQRQPKPRASAAGPAPRMDSAPAGSPRADAEMPVQTAPRPAIGEPTSAGKSEREPPAAPSSAASGSASPMARFWSFRPSKPPGARPEPALARPEQTVGPELAVEPQATAARHETADRPATQDKATPAPIPATATADSDVDAISGMIRKFVEQLGPGDPADGSPPHAAGESIGQDPLQPAPLDETTISASVGALRAAAGEMRRQADPNPAKDIDRGILPPVAAGANVNGPPPVGPGPSRLASIAEAISAEQVDVCLEPIVSLADSKARHYEISLLMRGDPGDRISAEDVRIARGTGMLPLIDSICISRAASVSRYMDSRGGGGALFATITAESLTSERFLSELADACRSWPRLPERLILSFRQADVLTFAAPHLETLKQLSAARFRFAASDLSSLEPGPAELKAAGFMFLRIGARQLADGLATGKDGHVTGGELTPSLAGTGLSIIATGIGSEEEIAHAAGIGVPLGQGPLFGPPRLVKAQALQQARGVAA